MSDKKGVYEILNDKYKGALTTRDVLARLYRVILTDLGITVGKWDNLMMKYLDDPNNNIPQTGKVRSTERGNMHKKLFADSLSFRTFLAGLKFLGALKITFTVQLHWGRKSTEHSINLVLTEEEKDPKNGNK